MRVCHWLPRFKLRGLLDAAAAADMPGESRVGFPLTQASASRSRFRSRQQTLERRSEPTRGRAAAAVNKLLVKRGFGGL